MAVSVDICAHVQQTVNRNRRELLRKGRLMSLCILCTCSYFYTIPPPPPPPSLQALPRTHSSSSTAASLTVPEMVFLKLET